MFLTILHHYLVWHYSQAYFQFFSVWKNMLWFVRHFFSIGPLLRSWFAPWKRITEERRKGWNVEEFFSTLLINLLSRIIGALIRSIVLVIGFISLLLIFFGGLIVYVAWTVAPALIFFLIILGISFIF